MVLLEKQVSGGVEGVMIQEQQSAPCLLPPESPSQHLPRLHP